MTQDLRSPAIVGLEWIVYPHRLTHGWEMNPAGRCEYLIRVTAPTCAYGLAYYSVRVWFEDSTNPLEFDDSLYGGDTVTYEVWSAPFAPIMVELWLMGIDITRGALAALTPTQLSWILTNSQPAVRESVIQALGDAVGDEGTDR